MNETRPVSVFLTPAADDFGYAGRLVRQLSERFGTPCFEPHLTLCSGSVDDMDPLIKIVAEMAGELPPLSLRIKGIGCSDDYFRTLFVAFEPDSLLAGLHERLGEIIRRREGALFRPHLSLLYREMPLAEKETLARSLQPDRNVIRFDGVKVVAPGNVVAGWRDILRWETLYLALLGGIPAVRVVLFDFGGVLASEGFRDGLRALALEQRLDPDEVHRAGMEEVYATGYVLGQGSEAGFWGAMRRRTGIAGGDGELTRRILDRFVLRLGMMETVRALKERGIRVIILSDQTDWLERIDRRDGFYGAFERVFNSYRIGKGKLDPSLFDDVVREMGVLPGEALFVDDMPWNVERAASRGLRTILFTDEPAFREELDRVLAASPRPEGFPASPA